MCIRDSCFSSRSSVLARVSPSAPLFSCCTGTTCVRCPGLATTYANAHPPLSPAPPHTQRAQTDTRTNTCTHGCMHPRTDVRMHERAHACARSRTRAHTQALGSRRKTKAVLTCNQTRTHAQALDQLSKLQRLTLHENQLNALPTNWHLSLIHI